jgi:hypothetical protein
MKLDARNLKSERGPASEFRIPHSSLLGLLDLWRSAFELASDLGFRASDLTK